MSPTVDREVEHKAAHLTNLLDSDSPLDTGKLRLEAETGVPPRFRPQVWPLLLLSAPAQTESQSYYQYRLTSLGTSSVTSPATPAHSLPNSGQRASGGSGSASNDGDTLTDAGVDGSGTDASGGDASGDELSRKSRLSQTGYDASTRPGKSTYSEFGKRPLSTTSRLSVAAAAAAAAAPSPRTFFDWLAVADLDGPAAQAVRDEVRRAASTGLGVLGKTCAELRDARLPLESDQFVGIICAYIMAVHGTAGALAEQEMEQPAVVADMVHVAAPLIFVLSGTASYHSQGRTKSSDPSEPTVFSQPTTGHRGSGKRLDYDGHETGPSNLELYPERRGENQRMRVSDVSGDRHEFDESVFDAFSAVMRRCHAMYSSYTLDLGIQEFLMLFNAKLADLSELFRDNDVDIQLWITSALRSLLMKHLCRESAYALLDFYFAREEHDLMLFHVHVCVAILAYMQEADVFHDIEPETLLARLEWLPDWLPIDIIVNRATVLMQESEAEGLRSDAFSC